MGFLDPQELATVGTAGILWGRSYANVASMVRDSQLPVSPRVRRVPRRSVSGRQLSRALVREVGKQIGQMCMIRWALVG